MTALQLRNYLNETIAAGNGSYPVLVSDAKGFFALDTSVRMNETYGHVEILVSADIEVRTS